jgi:predicted GNAT superfamily acetyltransferase
MDDGIPHPAVQVNASSSAQVMLEIPRDFRGLTNAYPDLAHQWREQTRMLFMTYLCEKGYAVEDFLNDEYEGAERAFYVLRKN